jgi:hypothetical protein
MPPHASKVWTRPTLPSLPLTRSVCSASCTTHRIIHSGMPINPINTKLNPTCHLLALLQAHHILHISRIRVNPLKAQLNPTCHLLALLQAHHILHISRIRVNPLNAQLNPTCHLLALLQAHHILHISRIRVNPLTFRHCASYI